MDAELNALMRLYRALAPGKFEFPLRYERIGQTIFDLKSTIVADIRGWGHLVGPLDLDEDLAIKVQDALAEFIVAGVNRTERTVRKELGLAPSPMAIATGRIEAPGFYIARFKDGQRHMVSVFRDPSRGLIWSMHLLGNSVLLYPEEVENIESMSLVVVE